MSIGSTVRRTLGRHEQRVADAYRHWFLDTAALADAVARFSTGPRILEIGCGDGHVTSDLLARLPEAHVTGIDISPTPGRLFVGDASRATFRTCTAADLASEGAEFDLVVVSDVLHHVDDSTLASVIGPASQLCRPGGVVAVKEWERNHSLGYMVGWFSDRVVSGQRVRFFTRTQLTDVVAAHLPGAVHIGDTRVEPRTSNLLTVWQTPSNSEEHRNDHAALGR